MAASIRLNSLSLRILERYKCNILIDSRRFKALRRRVLNVLSVDDADKLSPKSERPNMVISPVLSVLKPVAKTKVNESSNLEKYTNLLKSKTPDSFQTSTVGDERKHGNVKTTDSDRMHPSSSHDKKSKRKNGEKILDETEYVKFDMIKDGDRKFGPYILSAKSPFQRTRIRHILLEGRRHILDAINSGVKLKTLFFTDFNLLSGLDVKCLISNGTEIYRLRNKQMKVWSDMTTPPGIMAVCIRPNTSDQLIQSDELLQLTLICDSITDPNDLGAIIRSAAAACCHNIITTTGSVDVWDSRVLRAGAGAHFHCNIIDGVSWDTIHHYIKNCNKIYVTDRTTRRQRVSERQSIVQTDASFRENVGEELLLESSVDELGSNSVHCVSTDNPHSDTADPDITTTECKQSDTSQTSVESACVISETEAQGNDVQSADRRNKVSRRTARGVDSIAKVSQNTNAGTVCQNTNAGTVSQNTNAGTVSQNTNAGTVSQNTNAGTVSQNTNAGTVSQNTNAGTVSRCFYDEMNIEEGDNVTLIVSGSTPSKPCSQLLDRLGSYRLVGLPYESHVSALPTAAVASVIMFEVKRCLEK